MEINLSISTITLFLIYFLIKAHNVNPSPCVLSKPLLSKELRLAFQYKNDQLTLLREQEIQNGTILYMVCNSDDIILVECDNGWFNPPLPLPKCNNPLRPQLKKITDKSLCSYQLYLVGFQLNCKNSEYFFDTYKVCFDLEQKRAVFTINDAYPYVLSRSHDMRFDPDEIFTMNVFSAYTKGDVYNRFQELLGDQQTFMQYNEGERRIDRGHLTPVADFFMNTLISSTFKMINVIPQFHSINSGNWNKIEEWIRIPAHTPCKVCTGAFNWILELPTAKDGTLVKMYLRNNLIPIPLWTYKVVLNRHGVRTVFLQYNNVHDPAKCPPTIPQGICEVVECPLIFGNKNNYLNGYTFCCDERHFMKTVVPNLKGHC